MPSPQPCSSLEITKPMHALSQRLRPYEHHADQRALPGVFLLARLDGRGFSKLTKEVLHERLEAPFDESFHEAMLQTLELLMSEGFHIIYGHTHSDEFSLLFHREAQDFGRRLYKLQSTLAGLASASFSMEMKCLATFDCRLLQLPCAELVLDYFEWRQQVAYHNALHAHCYWALRRDSVEPGAAHEQLKGMNPSRLNDLLFERFQTNFNDLPSWQRRGVAMCFEQHPQPGVHPVTGEVVLGTRRGLVTHAETLPFGGAHRSFLEAIIASSETPSLQ